MEQGKSWHEHDVLLLTRRISRLWIEDSATLKNITVTRTGQYDYLIVHPRYLKKVKRVSIWAEVEIEDERGNIKTRKRKEMESLAALQRRVAEIALRGEPEIMPIPVKTLKGGMKQQPLFAAI
jgi:hypothetical protein